ncbi:hypothetical protein FS837_008636 [Tulasnella sp. UAMH 9824]|nr:hypothetical protein FS837_008636 [Tulasnella sp. UAMH 9824]
MSLKNNHQTLRSGGRSAGAIDGVLFTFEEEPNTSSSGRSTRVWGFELDIAEEEKPLTNPTACLDNAEADGRLGGPAEDFPDPLYSGVEEQGCPVAINCWGLGNRSHFPQNNTENPEPSKLRPPAWQCAIHPPPLFIPSLLTLTLAFPPATSLAIPGGFEPAGDVLHPLIPKNEKRGVTVVEGLATTEIGGGFIAVLPKDPSETPEGDDGSSKRRRRFLRQEEVVVPETLLEPSKRAVYCKNSGYGLCPNLRYCCPLGGLCCYGGGCCRKGQRCCSFDGCCPTTHNCVIVSGKEGCCPIGKICSAGGGGCVDAGYVKCSNFNFCCRPGYTCYRDSAGRNLCRAPGSNNDDNDPTTTTTTRIPNPTTVDIPDITTTTTNFQAQQITTTTPFTFPTTTPTPAAANTTSSSRVSSTPDIPFTAQTNGAAAVTSGMGYSALMSIALLALGQVLVVA